jgi:hypothetical protein
MLTIFAIPKPFTDPHVAIIQANAIRSWTSLSPACEVILFGRDAGVAELTEQVGAKHVGDVARNEYGTPLLDDVFARAASMARHEVLCYANADIILDEPWLQAVRRVGRRRFLLVARRINADVTERIDWPAHHAGRTVRRRFVIP